MRYAYPCLLALEEGGGYSVSMGLSEGAVRKLVNPNHRSHIRQVEKALRKVGRRLVVEDRAA